MKTTVWWMTMAVMLAALVGCGEVAHHQKAGDLEIALPWSREIPPGAPVAAGYLSIRNRGMAGDRLVAVRTDAAERVEIHEVRHEEGMARMRLLPDGLPLPAGDTVALAPGGYHLMFIGPREGFVRGGRVPATLVFAGAGEVEVAFEVRSVAATNATTDHAGH